MQISVRRESRLAFDNPVLVRGIAAIFFVNRQIDYNNSNSTNSSIVHFSLLSSKSPIFLPCHLFNFKNIKMFFFSVAWNRGQRCVDRFYQKKMNFSFFCNIFGTPFAKLGKETSL